MIEGVPDTDGDRSIDRPDFRRQTLVSFRKGIRPARRPDGMRVHGRGDYGVHDPLLSATRRLSVVP